MSKTQEVEVTLQAELSVWLTVCCKECGEDLGFKADSHSAGGLTVQVEPHKCGEAKQ